MVQDIDERDINLKFDGAAIEQQGGAPAEIVISALYALQRIAHLIGMKDEGRVFGHRAKPSGRVRDNYVVICKAPIYGSHVQPFEVGGRDGSISYSGRQDLLDMLKAFNSGDASSVEAAIPDPRERWFLADAAAGLIPPENSGIDITVRRGSYGPFSFRAENARNVVKQLREGEPPSASIQRVSGRLHSIDFTHGTAMIKPSGRSFRISYPSNVEALLQSNARKRIIITGYPEINATGDVTGFTHIQRFAEADGRLYLRIRLPDRSIVPNKPFRVAISYDVEEKIFTFEHKSLGLSAWGETYSQVTSAVWQELDILWRNYAMEEDRQLDAEANQLKKTLLATFKEEQDAA